MLMPKATLNENQLLVLGQDNIRLSWQFAIVQSKTKTESMDQRANKDFGFGVFTLYP